jgi:hypothetical protein
MQQQSTARQQQQADASARIMAEFIDGIGRAIALTVEVFLHRGFGSRYVGCGFIGVVIIFLFSMLFPGQNTSALLGFAALYGVMWLVALVNVGIRRWRKMNGVHSLYNGRPHLSRLLPNWKETNVKHVESLTAFLLGFGVHCLNRPLGDYLMFAAAFVFVRGYNLAVQRRDRAIRMNDQMIEQRLVAEQFREMQGQ